MRELLANTAVVLATITTLGFLIPQIVKLVRTGDSTGVSTSWPALGFVVNSGWFTYMIAQSLWWSVVAPFGTAVAYAVTLWALRRTGRHLLASYVRGAVWAIVLIAVTATLGWDALGVALALSYGVMVTPALWTAYRTPDPSGLSPGTWALGVTEGFLWGIYGWHHADSGIMTFASIAVLGSSLMLARYFVTRPGPSPAHP